MDQFDLTGKICLVTGANAGIGYAAALRLAKCHATVIMACRNEERGRAALAEAKTLTGSNLIELMLVDMSSQQSIRQFAQQFKLRHSQLHALIHNAANFDHTLTQPVLTEDGVETVFATNHLGPFLMTHLLLEMLKAGAPSRIITIASKGLLSYPFLDIEFDNLNGQRQYSLPHAYYHAKQAQVLFTFDLAERLKGTGVTVNCVRVGNVAIPDTRLTHLPGWMVKLYHLKRAFSITPEKMAETYIWLAADPKLEGVTGEYFEAPDRPVKANRNAYNRETQQRLWKMSEKLTHIVSYLKSDAASK